MFKNNKKGFTLLEILAVVITIGIITGIAIPLIKRIQENNKEKKFSTFSNSMKYGTKLYMNSYEADLFGEDLSGCAIVSYKDLNEKGLLKDVGIDNITCFDNNTFARVVKVNNRYGYNVNITCRNKTSNKVEHEEGLSSIICESESGAIISVTPSKKDTTKYIKTTDIDIEISSATGVYPDNAMIEYAFSTSQNEANIIGTWYPIRFNVMNEEDQYQMIEKGDNITAQSSIKTPSDYTGECYLLIKVLNLKDLLNRNWMTPEPDKPDSYGTYKIDNTSPTANITSTNHLAASQTVTLTMTDTKALGKYYFGTSNPATTNDLSYISISGTSKTVTTTINSGSTYYLRVYDQAGNYVDKSMTFYKTTLSIERGTVTPTSIITSSGNSFTPPTPSAVTGYTFNGWYDDPTNGNRIGKNGDKYTPSKNITLYAHWTINTHNVTCEDWFVDASNNRKVKLGTQSTKKTYNYGVTAKGSDWGNDATLSKYYSYYKYVGTSSSSVPDNDNLVVYRYFYAWTNINIYYANRSTEQGATVSFSNNGTNYTDIKNEVQNDVTKPWGTSYYIKNIRPVNTTEEFDSTNMTWESSKSRYSYTPTAAGTSMNIYLKYKTFSINLDRQNGSGGTGTIYEKYATGYYLNSNATSQMTTSANKITVPSKSYTVTLNYNGGGNNTNLTGTYSFGGYYTGMNGSGDQYIGTTGFLTSSASTTKFNANGTLYAKWTDNGVSLPVSPKRDGYMFKGWYTACNGGSLVGTSYKPGGSTTVCAQWDLIPTVYETGYDTEECETIYIPSVSGYYKLEVWGAQASSQSPVIGGYGGYSVGVAYLEKGKKYYTIAGSVGKGNAYGYNGGGSASDVPGYGGGNAGGGASHIALAPDNASCSKNQNPLSTFENKKGDVLIVAGGGGGAINVNGAQANGGHGGGFEGNPGGIPPGYSGYATGGTQSSGGQRYYEQWAGTSSSGSFGQGGYACNEGGGGGGWYGGGGSCCVNGRGGAGGSGYIGNSKLLSRNGITKAMYCYNCKTSNDASTRTYSTTNVSSSPISGYAKMGNGYVKITFIGTS